MGSPVDWPWLLGCWFAMLAIGMWWHRTPAEAKAFGMGSAWALMWAVVVSLAKWSGAT